RMKWGPPQCSIAASDSVLFANVSLSRLTMTVLGKSVLLPPRRIAPPEVADEFPAKVELSTLKAELTGIALMKTPPAKPAVATLFTKDDESMVTDAALATYMPPARPALGEPVCAAVLPDTDDRRICKLPVEFPSK